MEIRIVFGSHPQVRQKTRRHHAGHVLTFRGFSFDLTAREAWSNDTFLSRPKYLAFLNFSRCRSNRPHMTNEAPGWQPFLYTRAFVEVAIYGLRFAEKAWLKVLFIDLV
jgi:hypothetical protein